MQQIIINNKKKETFFLKCHKESFPFKSQGSLNPLLMRDVTLVHDQTTGQPREGKSASFLIYPPETGFYLDGGKSKIKMATEGFLVGDHSIRPRRAVRYVANKQASKTTKRKKKKPEWDVSRIYVRYIRYKFISLRKILFLSGFHINTSLLKLILLKVPLLI